VIWFATDKAWDSLWGVKTAYGEHKVLLRFQTHMSSNMLQSVENFNVQANILGNYVRDADICTQVYNSFIETIWNFEEKSRYPIMLASQFVEFLEHTRC
jgi:hypothetical protein